MQATRQHHEDREDDPLAPGRGFINAALISIAGWAIAAGVGYAILESRDTRIGSTPAPVHRSASRDCTAIEARATKLAEIVAECLNERHCREQPVSQGYAPTVLIDPHGRPLVVFAKGRVKYHAVVATDHAITLAKLDSLRGLAELQRKGAPYPARRAASFWLNRDFRPVTKRAKQVLRALVRRQQATCREAR